MIEITREELNRMIDLGKELKEMELDNGNEYYVNNTYDSKGLCFHLLKFEDGSLVFSSRKYSEISEYCWANNIAPNKVLGGRPIIITEQVVITE